MHFLLILSKRFSYYLISNCFPFPVTHFALIFVPRIRWSRCGTSLWTTWPPLEGWTLTQESSSATAPIPAATSSSRVCRCSRTDWGRTRRSLSSLTMSTALSAIPFPRQSSNLKNNQMRKIYFINCGRWKKEGKKSLPHVILFFFLLCIFSIILVLLFRFVLFCNCVLRYILWWLLPTVFISLLLFK